MKYIDMHTHTNISDGIYSPKELIKYAISKGLNGVAITDHDAIDGIDEAIEYAHTQNDFLVVPGIELSTEFQETEIHILGYNINHNDEVLKNTLSFLKKQRINRAFKIVEKLNKLNINITYNEIKNKSPNGVIGRPHVSRLLIEKGCVHDMKEAFEKYLGNQAPAYVPRYKITPSEAIELIKSSGGFSVIAHPKSINSDYLLLDILKNDVDGIEVYHPTHNSTDREKYLSIANKYNLIVTAGSDFHAPPSDSSNHGDLGDEKLSIENIKSIINKGD